jgi:hypothetical protein
MTLTSLINRPVAGAMSGAKMENFTYTTTGNAYAVIATVNVINMPAVLNSISVTGNNLLFKFEYSLDGVNWTASITDFPIAAASSAQLSAVRQVMSYRVSVKPAVADSHGSCIWQFVASQNWIPSEFKRATAYESITVTNAVAVGFTLATMDGNTRANVTVEDNPIRIRWDGLADPTTTEGHLIQAGDSFVLDFTADMYHFRAIAQAGNAKLRVTYAR